MIQLHSDCLVFSEPTGNSIPCSAEQITIQLLGEGASQVDPELLRHASAAVLHYFRAELGRSTVSMAEFSEALERVLRRFGLSVWSVSKADHPTELIDSDLRLLASESGKAFELVFFPRLRQEIRMSLQESPRLVRFRGLRGCVKQLAGARRWSARCQELSDHIVDFLRCCWKDEVKGRRSALVVR
jgi:hypothetical protein